MVTRDSLTPNYIYKVRGMGYAYSPHGTGLYWHDSLEEARAEHGDYPVKPILGISDLWA